MKKTVKESIVDCLTLGLKNGGIRYNQVAGVSLAKIRNWFYSNHTAEKDSPSFKARFRKGISSLEEDACIEKINVQRYKVNRKKLDEYNKQTKKEVKKESVINKLKTVKPAKKAIQSSKRILKKKILKRVSRPLVKKTKMASSKPTARKMTLKKSPKKAAAKKSKSSAKGKSTGVRKSKMSVAK